MVLLFCFGDFVILFRWLRSLRFHGFVLASRILVHAIILKDESGDRGVAAALCTIDANLFYKIFFISVKFDNSIKHRHDLFASSTLSHKIRHKWDHAMRNND